MYFVAGLKEKATRTRSAPDMTSGPLGVWGFITVLIFPKACATQKHVVLTAGSNGAFERLFRGMF